MRFIEEHIGTGGAEGEYYRSALKDLKLRWLLFIGPRPVGGDPGVQPVNIGIVVVQGRFQFIYFEDDATTVWYRLRIRDRKLEGLASLKGLRMAPSGLGWIGLTPDGSPISTRDAGSTGIYALDWEAP